MGKAFRRDGVRMGNQYATDLEIVARVAERKMVEQINELRRSKLGRNVHVFPKLTPYWQGTFDAMFRKW